MREYTFFVYILASKSRVLYTGMTNDLRFRVYEHKTGRLEGFIKRYRIHRLVYFEQYQYVYNAIAREKQIKNWVRQKRVALIESINPIWGDLAENWFTEEELRAKPGDAAVMKYNPDLVQTFSTPSKVPLRQPQPLREKRLRAVFRPSKRQTFGGPARNDERSG